MKVSQTDNNPLLEQVLPKYDKAWYRVPHLLWLNLCIAIPLLSNSCNGYDGSMLNGLQSLPRWQEYFDHPTGAILGALSNSYVLGSVIGFPFAAWANDKFGRKLTSIFGCVIIVIGSAIQCASQNYAMFFVARIIVGFGSIFCCVAGPLLVSECAYPSHRGVITAVFGPSWYAGAVIAAWVTYGAYWMPEGTDWSWRLPSLLQAAIPIFQLVFLPFIPESPRYLVSVGKMEEARAMLLKYHGGGDESVGGPLVDFEMAEIEATLEYESHNKETGYINFFKTKANRKRLFICIWVSISSQLCGNGLVSYYLNLVLNSIGITEASEQLVINGGLMIYNLGTAIIAGFIVGYLRRRLAFIGGLSFLLCTFVVWTAVSAVNQQTNFENESLGNAVLAMIFLFYACYNLCLNALPTLYLTEVLPFYLRGKGINIYSTMNAVVNVYNGFVNPIAMEAIEWKYYIVFCCLIAVELIGIILFFPETYGRTLEEAAAVFGDGITAEAMVLSSQKPDQEFVEDVKNEKTVSSTVIEEPDRQTTNIK